MLKIIENLLQASDRKERAALATVIKLEGLPGVALSTKTLVREDGTSTGTLGPALQGLAHTDCVRVLHDRQPMITRYEVPGGAVRVFIEPVEDRPQLLIVGAGHISQYLAKVGRMIGFEVSIVDDRAEFAALDRFPEVDAIMVGEVTETIRSFGISPDTYVVLVPRNHEQGDKAVRQVVGSRAAYIGMIGSRKRAEAVAKDLTAEGFSADDIGKVRSPIGLKIGAESPEEIAVAIAAELISVRRTRSESPGEAR